MRIMRFFSANIQCRSVENERMREFNNIIMLLNVNMENHVNNKAIYRWYAVNGT